MLWTLWSFNFCEDFWYVFEEWMGYELLLHDIIIYAEVDGPTF